MVDFNKCSSKISEALDAHDRYLDTLNNWYDWLEAGGEENNGLRMILFKLINDTIKKREPGGEWADIDSDYIPPADALKDYVNSGKYNSFKTVVESARTSVEEAAHELIRVIDSPEFLYELELLPYDEQLLYADRLAEQLHSCNVGLLYQIQSLNKASTTPLPLFHPDRLTQKEGDFFSDEFPVMRRAGKLYASYYMKLIPALMADYNIARFMELTLKLLVRYHRLADLPNITQAADDIGEFGKLLTHLREFHQENPSRLSIYGRPSAAALGVILELGNLYIHLDKMRKDPNARSTFGVLSSLAKVRLALASSQEALGLSYSLKLAPRRVALLAVLTCVYDVTIRAIDTHEAWQQGDLSVAAGKALEGVGIATAAAVAALTAAGKVSPTISINPLVGALLTLGALAITFVGTLLVVYTRDTDIEQWFYNNFFGNNWDNVASDVGPGTVMFRWKNVDGSPNLERQISDYLSMFYPLRLRLERGQVEPRIVSVVIEPVLAFHEAQIIIKRVIDTGSSGGGNRYALDPVYVEPLNTEKDLDVYGGPKHISPIDPAPGDRLVTWIRSFSPVHFSQTDPTFDPTGSFLEVEVTVPDQVHLHLSTGIEANPDLLDNFTFVYRSRRQIL